MPKPKPIENELAERFARAHEQKSPFLLRRVLADAKYQYEVKGVFKAGIIVASCFLALGLAEEAEECYEHLLQSSEKIPSHLLYDLKYFYCTSLFASGKYEQAAKVVMEIAPYENYDNTTMLCNMCFILISFDMIEHAENLLNRITDESLNYLSDFAKLRIAARKNDYSVFQSFIEDREIQNPFVYLEDSYKKIVSERVFKSGVTEEIKDFEKIKNIFQKLFENPENIFTINDEYTISLSENDYNSFLEKCEEDMPVSQTLINDFIFAKKNGFVV